MGTVITAEDEEYLANYLANPAAYNDVKGTPEFDVPTSKLFKYMNESAPLTNPVLPTSAYQQFQRAQSLQQFKDVEKLAREGLELSQLWTVLALSMMRQKDGREGEAWKIFVRTLCERLAANGAQHPDTLLELQNIAGTFIVQKRFDLAERVLRMAIILARHCPKGELHDYCKVYAAKARHDLKGCLMDLKDDVLAAEVTLEALDVLEGEQGPEAFETKKLNTACGPELLKMGLVMASKGLGYCDVTALLLEKGMATKAKDKQAGAAMAPQKESLDNLKGLSVSQLKAKFSQMRMPWPSGMEKAEVAELLHEKLSNAAASPDTLEEEHDFLVMYHWGMSLYWTGKERPEMYARAEAIHRQLYAAKLKSPRYGESSESTIASMEDLSDDLAKQFKYVEALALTEQALNIREQVYGLDSEAYQGNVPRRRDQLKAQSAFRSKAEKRFGLRNTWTRSEDEIGATMYQDAVHEAQKAREGDPKLWDSIEEGIAFRRKPAPYDPADQKSVHWAAVMAALGVHDGYFCDSPLCIKLHHKIKPLVRSPGPSDQSDSATSDFVAVVSAMKKAMPGGLGVREQTALEDAYAALIAMIHNKPMALESAERVAHSYQATKQMEADGKHNAEVLASTERVVPGLGPTTKPMKMCMGCGLKDFKLQRCSRCLQAYACCKECFDTAWPHHKRSCVPKARKEDSAQATAS